MAITWPALSEGQWNLSASAVVSGTIKKLRSDFTFWVTTVSAGASAPENSIKLKSPVIFQDSDTEIIQDYLPIDIYIWIENADTSGNATIQNAIEVNAG